MMIKRTLKNMAGILFIAAAITVGLSSPAYAATCATGGSAEDQVLRGVGQTGTDCDDSGVTNAINGIVNVLSIIVGIAAVIMLIIAGLKYVTSSGDSGKIASAKSTLIYALVGVAIATLAQFFVNYVFDNANKASTPPAQQQGGN